MKLLPDTALGGYVVPPPDVHFVVQVGFFNLWLTRDTKAYNGREGKLYYVHHHHLWVTRWLFNEGNDLIDRKWKLVDNFERDANAAFLAKVNQYLGERK